MLRKISAVPAALLSMGIAATPPAQATEMPFDFDHCYSGKVNMVTAGKALTVFSYELLGVLRSNTERQTLDNHTSHCVGVAKVMEGKVTMDGYCKFMSPEEDVLIVQIAGVPKGTWTVLEGSGKWQGTIGNASYEQLTKTKGIKPGTNQHCYKNTGTLVTP